MLPNPLHPAIVHFPVVLALLLPLFIAGGFWAMRRGASLRRAWLLPTVAAAALAGSSWLAVETGEEQGERVERVVAERALDAHEDLAEAFLTGSAVVAVIAAAGLVGGLAGRVARLATVTGSLVLAGMVVRVGHTGGELVYKRPTGSITLGVRNVADIQFTAGVVSAMGITNGKWFFFVVTNEWVDQVAGTSRHNFYIITQDGAHLATGTGTKIPATPARNVAIGNPGLTTTNYDLMAINCARFFTAQRTLAQDEIVDIYTRARIIAERRGIELV